MTLLIPLFFLLSSAFTTIATASPAYPSVLDTVDSADCSLSSGDANLVPIRREVYGEGRIFDISHRYTNDMPAWGSKDGLGQFLWLPASTKNGSLANNSEMKMASVHSGTHVDAPGHVFDHYFDAGFDVDTLDLETLNAEVMELLRIPKGIRRVLFRTLNTDRRLMFKKEFDTTFVGLTKDGAEWLVKNTDIKLIGTDYLSVAAYDGSTHSSCSSRKPGYNSCGKLET